MRGDYYVIWTVDRRRSVFLLFPALSEIGTKMQ